MLTPSRMLLACAYVLCNAGILSSVTASSGLFVDNGHQTVRVASLPNKHKKAIKQQMLDLLGLPRRPRAPREASSAPHYMMDLYRSLEQGELVREYVKSLGLTMPGMEEDLGRADMITSFVNHAHRNKKKVKHSTNRRFYFELEEISDNQLLTGAELRLFRQDGGNRSKNVSFRIDLYRLLIPKNNGDRDIELEGTLQVDSQQFGWLEFNVTDAAQYWIAHPGENLGLFMIITAENGEDLEPRHAGLVTAKGPSDKLPFMVGFFNTINDEVPLSAARSRRSADLSSYWDQPSSSWDTRTHRSYARNCQRRTLYVNFMDLNWGEWIIAPVGYPAYFCQGDCPFPLGNSHLNSTNHAIVQTLVHIMDPRNTPTACCIPTKLQPISVLFFDDNENVILKKYKNMVVESCGCH